MKRITIKERDNYIEKLENQYFYFHHVDGVYWDESAYYEFNTKEIDDLEIASNELFEMMLQAVQYVIDNNLYDKLHISPNLVPNIIKSWEEDEPSVYGRFDFGYDGKNIKLLEFNADTPTSLYEASVVQWYWLQDVFKDKDQFNSIHEKLIDYWKSCLDYFNGEILHFTCIEESLEDYTTVEYIRDTAEQAGIKTKFIKLQDIGYNKKEKIFFDNESDEILNIFKLYPYEWMSNEEFGNYLSKTKTKWIEPAWKSILSNKGILPILYQLFPNNKYILPCYFDNSRNLKNYVKKPIYSREGANIEIFKDGYGIIESSKGDYGEDGYIYQEYFELPKFNDNVPIIGSWIIGGESVGIGIRETKTLITDNLSRFVSHIINN